MAAATVPGESLPTLLSIGCGAAAAERAILERGIISHLTTVDPSAYSFSIQQQLSAQFPRSWSAIQATAETLCDLAPYLTADIVLFNMSLHHASDVNQALLNTRAILERSPNGGHVVALEYVGPPRFAYGKHDRQTMEAMFATIPERFRRLLCEPFVTLSSFAFPDPVAVAAADPSEAPYSDRIRPLFYTHFRVIRDIALPGTFFQYGLNNIAGNFAPSDPEAVQVIMRLYQWEKVAFDECAHFRLLVGTT